MKPTPAFVYIGAAVITLFDFCLALCMSHIFVMLGIVNPENIFHNTVIALVFLSAGQMIYLDYRNRDLQAENDLLRQHVDPELLKDPD